MRAVADGVAHDHVQKEYTEHTGMHRHQQQEQWREDCLHQGLDRMEGIRRPGRQVQRGVMPPMHGPKPAPIVQCPVRPVEPGVVGDDDEHEADPPPGPAAALHVGIDLDRAIADQKPEQQPVGGKDGDGGQRIGDLAPDLSRRWCGVQDAPASQAMAQQHLDDEPDSAGGGA